MEMPLEHTLSLAAEFLEKGKKLFELEKYGEAIGQLEQAQILILQHPFAQDLALNGEVQIWLANTYDMLGDTKRAIAICQKLTHHRDSTIAKQADFLVNVFSAPQLSQLTDATSTLPSLAKLDQASGSFSNGKAKSYDQELLRNQDQPSEAIAKVSTPNNYLNYFLISVGILLGILFFVWSLRIGLS